jgi:hypothetical protein
LPSVNQLYQDFKAQGLEVLLIAFREPQAEVARVARERGYTAPVLLDASGDITGRVYGVFGPHKWASPATRTVMTDLLRAR